MQRVEINGLEYKLYMSDGSEGGWWKAGLWYACPSDYDEADGPWIMGQKTAEEAIELCKCAIGDDARFAGEPDLYPEKLG